MTKISGKIALLFLLAGCTTKEITLPEAVPVRLMMATVGVANFEDYIHSLTVYAFRKESGGNYFYHSTLADLDSRGIEELTGLSDRGDTKLLKTELPVGTYEIYLVGNGRGQISGGLQAGITLPHNIRLNGNSGGLDEAYFLGKTTIRVVTSTITPVPVTLDRAVSKLLLVLYDLPAQVDSVRLSLTDIAGSVGIDGSLPEQGQTAGKAFAHLAPPLAAKDSVVYELLTLPAVGGSSPFYLTFHTPSGQEKTKEMAPLSLLPDKFVQITAKINDAPGALLSFDVAVNTLIVDSWFPDSLPDFSLKPVNR